jgi:hypothetical protein
MLLKQELPLIISVNRRSIAFMVPLYGRFLTSEQRPIPS